MNNVMVNACVNKHKRRPQLKFLISLASRIGKFKGDFCMHIGFYNEKFVLDPKTKKINSDLIAQIQFHL